MENTTYQLSPDQIQALSACPYLQSLCMTEEELIAYVTGLINETLTREEFNDKYIDHTATGWRVNKLRRAIDGILFVRSDSCINLERSN